MMAALQKPHFWSLYVCALTKDSLGRKDKLDNKAFEKVTERIKAKDLNARSWEILEDLERRVNPVTYKGHAWIASPHGEALSIEEIDEVLHGLYAWDEPTVEQQIAELMAEAG